MAPATSLLVAVLERVPDIVWRYRLVPEPGFEYVSPSVFALTGYTPGEHYDDPDLGRRIAHPDDLPLLEKVLSAPAAHTAVTLRWRHKEGAVFATEQRLTLERGSNGEVVAIEGVGRPVVGRRARTRVQRGDIVLDLAGHRVLVDDGVVDLTPAEHRILAMLIAAEAPVAARELADRLWGDNAETGVRTVQVHISNLRRKLEQDPHRPARLLTHRGVGYALHRSEPAASS